MKPSLIDLPVLLIFFNRPDTFEKVFEKVKIARPSKLFLACDGARENNENDIFQIEKCKQLVSDIDWECEVYRNYSEINKGCGKGPYDAICWFFENVEYGAILEDDCVVDSSWFLYMKELLEKYRDDTRVGVISGLNHFYEWDCSGSSYFFTKTGATLAWGTWKRVWNCYDFYLNGIESEFTKEKLKKEIYNKKAGIGRVKSWEKGFTEISNGKKVSYWDIQFGFVKYTQNLLCIVPCNNLVCNIGVGDNATHSKGESDGIWKKNSVFFMPTKKMEFPLQHPAYIMCDRLYDDKYFKNMAYPPKIVRLFKRIKKKVMEKFLKW